MTAQPQQGRVEITIPAGPGPLYHRYHGQSQPQVAYLEIDPRDASVRWDWSAEIGSGVPGDVWHGIILRISASPYLSSRQLANLSDEIQPLVRRLIDGGDTEWDGSNHRGTWTVDADDARIEIERLIERVEPGCGVFDAAQWIEGVYDWRSGTVSIYPPDLRPADGGRLSLPGLTDAQIAALADYLADGDSSEDEYVIDGEIDAILAARRDELAAEAEDE